VSSSVEWLAQVAEIRRLARAYTQATGDDRPGRPSEALISYLRCLWREPDFGRAAIAVGQIRNLIDQDWDDADIVEAVRLLGLPRPSDGRTVYEWLQVVADLLEHALEHHDLPADAPPDSAYEWTTSFPDLTGLIATAYHQDTLVLHGSSENALADTALDASALALTRAVGQVHEILALGFSEDQLERGVRWMGLGIRNPASSYRKLLQMIVDVALVEVSRRHENREIP